MKEKAHNSIQIIDSKEYSESIADFFSDVPAVAKPLLNDAKESFDKIKEMIYTLPAMYEAIQATVPKYMLQAVLTNEQKKQIAKGALKLMTKKDGTLMANLINPKTKRIITTIPLKSIRITPDLAGAMTNLSMQMQLAQISRDVQAIERAIEGIHEELEDNRLATAYSCQQQFLQAIEIKDPQLKTTALMRIVSAAEDSRNLLMLGQKRDIEFINSLPTSMFDKILHNPSTDKINKTINELRESLSNTNIVSFVEAMAYQEMGESNAARKSLAYYGEFIQNTYLSTPGLIGRLDQVDPVPENYWSETLPEIHHNIIALPCVQGTEIPQTGSNKERNICQHKKRRKFAKDVKSQCPKTIHMNTARLAEINKHKIFETLEKDV